MSKKTDQVKSSDLGQSKLRVPHHQQREDHGL